MRRLGVATGRGPHQRPTSGLLANYRADFWPGPQLGWATPEPETGRPLNRPLFSESGQEDLWTFRRIRYGGHYRHEISDVTLVNWPQVDYWLTPVVGVQGQSGKSPWTRLVSYPSDKCAGLVIRLAVRYSPLSQAPCLPSPRAMSAAHSRFCVQCVCN